MGSRKLKPVQWELMGRSVCISCVCPWVRRERGGWAARRWASASAWSTVLLLYSGTSYSSSTSACLDTACRTLLLRGLSSTSGSSSRRPSDVVAPVGERPDHSLSANGVRAVNEDRSDLERPVIEGCFFQEGHHRQDRVVTAEIVVEPELVDEGVVVLLQELDAFTAGAGNPRGPGQRPEVVNAEDNGRVCGRVYFHRAIIAVSGVKAGLVVR